MSIFICGQVFFIILSRCTNAAPVLSETDEEDHQTNSHNGCGRASFKPKLEENVNRYERVKRIVNGETAIAHSWPWTVFLKLDGNFFCGGTLIDPLPYDDGTQSDVVLTAAHCIENKNYTLIDVTLGAHELTNVNESSRVTVGVSQIRIHEEYKWTREYDIAIIKLEKPVKFNDYIRPICLPEKHEETPAEALTDCYATGWGLMSDQDQSVAEKLQQVLLVVDEIENAEPTFDIATEDTKGICHGDSGGPLVCKVGDTWTQFGIASASTIPSDWPRNGTFIRYCARKNMTAIFVQTSYHKHWIFFQMIYFKYGIGIQMTNM